MIIFSIPCIFTKYLISGSTVLSTLYELFHLLLTTQGGGCYYHPRFHQETEVRERFSHVPQATQTTSSKACISIQVCDSEIGLLIAECEGRPREESGRDQKESNKDGGTERLWGDRVCGEDALTTSLSPCVWWAQPQAWGPWVLNSELGAHPAYPQGGCPGADNMSSILFPGPQVHCQPSLLWCPLRC